MSEPTLLDTHVHFWDKRVAGLHWPFLKPGFTHGGLRGTEQLDQRAFLPPDLRREIGDAGVEGVVHVQAVGEIDDPSLESRWLDEVADAHGWPDAIVGSCYLWRTDAPELLRRHARTARVRGVRDLTAVRRLDPDDAAAALEVACDLGYSVEVRRRTADLATVGEIARRWPDLVLVLSHGCFPPTRTDDDLRAWRAALDALAEHPNIVCKISAAAGSADPDWTPASIAPWVLGCIEALGPARCMFGSNWPIDRLFGTYSTLVGAYRSITAHLPAPARADVFSGTARRVYRL